MADILTAIQNQIGAAGTTIVSGGVVFPADLNTDYCMYLHFYKYSRPSVAGNAEIAPLDVIALPLPVGLIDSQSVDYSEEPLGPALGVATEALNGLNVGQFVTGVVAAGAAGAAGATGLEGAVSAGLGVAANPFMTVLFKNPKYRTYEFAWRLFPRNVEESRRLKQIYKMIKYHSLPTRLNGAGGALLTYPDMVKPIIILNGTDVGDELKFMPYKYGVVTNVTFNMAPDGVPSFHKGGEPTAVDIRIAIQEIEYFFRDNYA